MYVFHRTSTNTNCLLDRQETHTTNVLMNVLIVQKRKRATIIHVSDVNGVRLQGAEVVLEQVSKEFPFGSAIASTIIGNEKYQVKFYLKIFFKKNAFDHLN